MFTQCSKCETVFKLSAEVLRAAGGQVRCGKCGQVFNALAQLAEDSSAFTTGETEIELEFRADSILESPAPMTPPRNAQAITEDFAPPGVEIARLQVLDWDEGETGDDPDESGDGPGESGDGPGETGDGPGETSMEFTLPPGELDRIFVESKKHAAWPSPPPHPEDAANFDTAPEAAPEAAPSGIEVERIDPPVRQRASPFALASLAERAFMPWLIAAIASALLLIVQVVHQNREWLAAHSPLGGTLRALYSTMGAPVSPLANLSAYQLRQWGVTGDPAGDGTLRVRASILNTAAQLEPYPLLRVTLANRFGSRIGTRDFEPSEYLGKPLARLLAPGERVDAILDILDPGKNAEGFEIDVCLRGADKKVSCANDAAPAQAKR